MELRTLDAYFLPDKPSRVPESNPNSADESESEDTSVAKKGRKYCFGEEWLSEFDWLRSQRRIPRTANFAVDTRNMWGTRNLQVMQHYTVKTQHTGQTQS